MGKRLCGIGDYAKKKKKKRKGTISALKPTQASNKSEETRYTKCPNYIGA